LFDSGEYIHLGLKDGVQRALQSNYIADDNEILLQFNIDGLSISQRDRCVQLLDKSIVIIRNILQQSDKVMIVYTKFNKVRDFFDYPLPSSALCKKVLYSCMNVLCISSNVN